MTARARARVRGRAGGETAAGSHGAVAGPTQSGVCFCPGWLLGLGSGGLLARGEGIYS